MESTVNVPENIFLASVELVRKDIEEGLASGEITEEGYRLMDASTTLDDSKGVDPLAVHKDMLGILKFGEQNVLKPTEVTEFKKAIGNSPEEFNAQPFEVRTSVILGLEAIEKAERNYRMMRILRQVLGTIARIDGSGFAQPSGSETLH